MILPPKGPDAEPEKLTAKLRLKPHDKLTLVTFELGQAKIEGVWKVEMTMEAMQYNGRWIRTAVGSKSSIVLDMGMRWKKVQKVGEFWQLNSPKIMGRDTAYRIKSLDPKHFVGTMAAHVSGRNSISVRQTVKGTRIR